MASRKTHGVEHRRPLLISLLFFLLALAWFSQGAAFPPFYHPDETSKVIQIQKNTRNFHHPLLMINSAAVLYQLGGEPESKLQTVVLTRWVSIVFSAVTVALLAYAAFLLAGTVAQICCGWLVLSEPLLFELAHYLKEDPALAMGFAAVFLTFLLYVRRSTPANAAWVGLAAALAISAKYIGIFPALLALAGMVWQSGGKKRPVLIFAGVCVVAVLAINWQAIVHLANFQYGLGREIGLFEKRADEAFSEQNFHSVDRQIGFLTWMALAAWLASPWYRKKRLDAAEWLILAATFGYTLLVLAASRSANRYILPVAVALPLIISVAACWVGSWLGGLFASRWKPSRFLGQAALCVAVILVLGARDIPSLANLNAGFHGDARRDLVAFIRAHVPPDAVLAEDDEVDLPDGTARRTFEGWDLANRRVRPKDHRHLGDEFTMAGLRTLGVTHVVVFMDDKTRSALKGGKLKPRDKKLEIFLSALKKNSVLLWSCESAKPEYLHPPLRLYELSQKETKSGNFR